MLARTRSGSASAARFTSFVVLAAVLSTGIRVRADEYRAFWVDAWGAGIHSQSEVEKLLGRVGDANLKGDIRNANCNAVVIQVRRRADVCYPSGMGEPYMSGLSPWNFNALQAAIDAAHDTTGGKKRIEVHCWMVTFATDGGLVWTQHNNPADPDNYWATEDHNGNWTSDEAFDPGHPKCLEYLTDVAMDLVNHFDIDGIHWDYIRFTANNQGYNPTSIARYNARYGLSGSPSYTSEQFKQWRRDQVTALVRRVYAKMLAVKPQVKHSGAFVTWNPSPVTSTRSAFMNTRPYYDVYSDWDAWLEEGIVDLAVPMTYYNWASLPNDYRRWMNFEKDRKFNRFMLVGPGIYLNSRSNAIYELQMTRDASPAGNYAQGFCGYSYRVPYSGGNWDAFSPYLVADVTPSWADIPVLPWKANPTTGHISGTVTYHPSGQWADHAVVSISGPENRSMYVDGTGFYAFVDLPPGTYTVTATKTGYPDATTAVDVQIGQVTGNMYVCDLQFGATNLPPAISNVNATNLTMNSATIAWTTDQASSSQVEYGTTVPYDNLTPVDSTPVTAHAVNLTGLASNTVYHFRVISGNDNGNSTSLDYTFSTSGPPQISNVQATGVSSNSATITWTTNAPADSQVRYGLTSSYSSQTPVNPSLLTAHSMTVTGLSSKTTYHYQAVSANAYGSDQSTDMTFTTADPSSEIIIDNLDPGCTLDGSWSTGSSSVVPKIGSNYLYTNGTGNPSYSDRSVRWTPEISDWGFYDVYVYYQIGANRTTGAYYRVVHADGTVTSVQNQYSSTPNQGGWFLIGENLRFAPGSGGYVELGNNSLDTLYVSADAAKFVYKGTDPTPPSTPVVTDDGDYTGDRTSLHATWSSSDDETGIAKYDYRILQAGGAVVRDWMDAGTDTGVTVTNLSLMVGANYVFEVRATNGAGLVSAVGVSDGIRVFTFDVNGDEKVNEVDTAAFLGCLSGPGTAYLAGGGVDCGRFDGDGDSDVDLEDFGVYQACLSGDAPPDLNCLD